MDGTGQRIKELIRIMDIKSREFGEKLGFAPQSVSSWKNRTKIPKYIIKNIARTFNVSEQWLETGEGSIFLEPIPGQIRETQAPYGNNPRSSNGCQMAMIKAQKAGLNEEELGRMEAIIAKITDLLTTEDRKERERYATVIYGMIALCQPALSQQGGRANGELSSLLEKEK